MSLSMHLCVRSLRQTRHVVPKHFATRIQFLSHMEKCTKTSVAALSQLALENPYNDTKDVERVEVLLIKNLLAGGGKEPKQMNPNLGSTTTSSNRNIDAVEKRSCMSEKGQCNYKSQLVWQDILVGPRNDGNYGGMFSKNYSNLIGVSHEMWYCTNIGKKCPKKHSKENIVECNAMDRMLSGKLSHTSVVERISRSGPSPEQLSLVLLKLREELPNFFEGRHRYSLYSKDILFVNKITRTTTRTLKSYKYIMSLMAYAGKLFWSRASLDVLRITKHSEDNTIKVRWTAKGIPWYQLPFLLLSGKPQSLFYRYVDGFSIFEVGRDGLVHCHRLDKVMPTSTPERQKWSLRMQVLALLGLAEITHEPCEAFQVKSQEIK